MKKILITYADESFRNSAWRLKKQAKKSGNFDKFKIYTPKDLPSSIKSSPLFLFNRGGGYWVWKPYIINDALSKAKDGDIVYYLDAGCSINPNVNDWGTYNNILENHNAILFKYRDGFDYGWSRFGINSVKLKHWIKPSTAKYFKHYFNGDNFLETEKIWAGFIIIKKGSFNNIIDEWLKITLFHPELIMDAFGKELSHLPEEFNSHRHDQSILTPLIYRYKDIDKIAIIPETAESRIVKASVYADRYKTGKMNFFENLKFKLYWYLKSL